MLGLAFTAALGDAAMVPFPTVAGTWEAWPAFATPAAKHGVCSAVGYIWVHIPSSGLYKADPIAKTSSLVSTASSGMSNTTIFAINDEIYIGSAGEANTNRNIRKYHPRTNTWVNVGDAMPAGIPANITNSAQCWDGRYYYTISGQVSSTPTAASARWDSWSGKWEMIADYPVPQGQLAAVAFNGKVYVGYSTGTGQADKFGYVYDPSSNTWAATGWGSTVTKRAMNPELKMRGRQCWVPGGFGNYANHLVDMITGTATTYATTMPNARFLNGPAVYKDQLHVIGGWTTASTTFWHVMK